MSGEDFFHAIFFPKPGPEYLPLFVYKRIKNFPKLLESKPFRGGSFFNLNTLLEYFAPGYGTFPWFLRGDMKQFGPSSTGMKHISNFMKIGVRNTF